MDIVRAELQSNGLCVSC